MNRARNRSNNNLPSGGGVMLAASLGALFWAGAFALFW